MSPEFDASDKAVVLRPPPPDSLAEHCANHAPVPTNGHFPAGTVFGDWRVTAFIGRGGNGEVYCAEHVALGTPAAVKVLMRNDERAKERFAREAKMLAKMKSKSFPRFFAYGETNPLNRDKMHPAARAYFDRSFPTNKTWTRSMPTQIAIAETNHIKAVDISLGKKSVSFKNTIRLSPEREYWITGPGTLDADLFCPTTAVVRLRNCVLLNRTKRLYPENGIQYHLEGGAYLNFISVRKMPQGLRLNDFIEPFDSASNQLRFGGPVTVEELNEERDRETRLRLSFEKSPSLPYFGLGR